MDAEGLRQAVTALGQNPWLLVGLGLSLLSCLLSALYVLHKTRSTEPGDTWPYRFYRWLRANSLGLALIVTIASLLALAFVVWRLIPTIQQASSTAPIITPIASPTPVPTVPPAPKEPEAYSVQLVDPVGTPLPTLTPGPTATSLPTDTPPATPTPTPTNPYLVVTSNVSDYYLEPQGLPLRFDLQNQTALTLSVTGRLSDTESSNTVLGQWVQVCCLANAEATAVWVLESAAITLENRVALKYVPIIVLPTRTSTPAPTPTPTAAYLRLATNANSANLFTGPGETFPHVAQLGPGVVLEVNGKTIDGNWLRVCCIDTASGNNTLWVRNQITAVEVLNSQALNVWATPVLVLATPVPFMVNKGPEPLGLTNNFLTIYAKIAGNAPFFDKALPGYFLAVEFQPKGQIGFAKRESTNRGENGALRTSQDQFSADGNVMYNYKFEYTPAGNFEDGEWQFWLTNAAGDHLSEIAKLTSTPQQRGVYVVWHQVR